MIKLEALRVFVTVAELGNIKEASEQICRTASAISMTLKQLEEEIGGQLFESDRKNNLTALGEFVLQTGRMQVSNYDKAIATIHAYAKNKIGHLTLACVPSVAANLIPSLFPGFIKNRPNVVMELLDIDSRAVRLMLETGQADIGIAGQPIKDTLVTFEPLFRDQFKVICSTASALSKLERAVRWSDLENEILILNGASDKITSPQYQELADKASLTVRNVTSLLAMTKSGLGITLLPALATTHLLAGLAALELEDTSVERVVGLIERRGVTRSPVAAAFREHVLDKMPVLVEQIGVKEIPEQRP
ncbi:hypothetical protein A9Q83_18680 [Alphaproteobacteria bacterium 46_93_T64]|nr:hypothetical protein A9Q83_18680 [Alphaproteobacteria bacterium 46_93_T64]